jgi:hypothetical protein
MTYDNFCEAVVRSGQETAISIECKCKGWCKASVPAIDETNLLCNCLQNKNHLTPIKNDQPTHQLKDANKCNRDLVDLAKACWYSGIRTNIHNMRMNSRLEWEIIHLLTGRKTTYHKTKVNMAMKLESGNLASNTKENMSIFSMHFHKVLDNHRPVDDLVIDLIKQKPCLTSIDTPITFREIKHAIIKLKWGKASGLNNIPPKAIKAMGDMPQRTVNKHVSDFFEGRADHEGWHKSQYPVVPKKGNLNLNKWQGVMLIDMCSKVFSSSMTALAFKLLDMHGTCFQFGSTPKLGCRDGLFTLKALLNAQWNHSLVL